MSTVALPIDYHGDGVADHTLEIHVTPGGYWLSVRGPRDGLVVPFTKSFEDILTRGWLYDYLTGDRVFLALLRRLGVDVESYRDRRYYYSGGVA